MNLNRELRYQLDSQKVIHLHESVGDFTGIVYVYSNKCPVCHDMIDPFQTETRDRKMDVRFIEFDSEIALCDEIFEISNVPTLLALRHGEEIARLSNITNERQIKDFLALQAWDDFLLKELSG